VTPTDYRLSCGDGGNGLTGVHWTNWTPAGATGAGTEYLNGCTPSCAEGKIIDYPVDIALTGSYLAAQGEPFAYAKITLTYLAARPLIYVTVNGKVEATHPASWSPPLPEWRPSR
jgi:type 1 glutamine amidotransferase